MSTRSSIATLAGTAILALAALTASPPPAKAESCREQPVIMISTSWCGYCRKARTFFNENRIEFEEIDAERTDSPGIRETYRKTGVPIIIVGAEQVRGFNERRLRQLLCLPG
ncbi:MAG: glutaredoxin family protein [Hyphomicrobiaceae bacterium]